MLLKRLMMAGTAQVRRDPEVRVFGLLRERGSEKLRLNRKIVPLGGDDTGLAAEQEDARDEYELAKSAAFAKLGTPHRLDEKEYRRAAGFLMRKGFGSSEIRRALEEYQDSTDEEF